MVTLISFLGTLQNGWTTWDDDVYVTDNAHIREWSVANMTALWTSHVNGSFLPLTMMTYCIDYTVGGFNPKIYHGTNLLLHLINTVLVFLFINRLSDGNKIAALVTAMIFGIHPMHVESVAWISARKDVLSGFFFLLCLLSYVRYVKHANQKGLLLALLFFFCAMLSKVVVLAAPLILLLIDRYVGREWHWNLFKEKTPFFLISFIFLIIGLISQSSAGAIRQFSVLESIVIPHYSFYFYVEKFIVPTGLSSFYPYPKMVNGSYPVVLFLAIPVVWGMGYLIWKNRSEQNLLFGFLFFLLLVLPILQVIRFSNIIAADRFTYLSYIGLSFPVGYWVSTYYETSAVKVRALLILIGAVITVFLSAATIDRVPVWKNSNTLWQDVFTKYPDPFE